MKNPFDPRTPTFDAGAIQQTIQRALASAGLDTTTGTMREVSETIERALAAGGLMKTAPVASSPHPDANVVDVVARVVPEGEGSNPEPQTARPTSEAPWPTERLQSFSFSNAAGTRAYKVHLPEPQPQAPCPVLVMLHGCTQSADDFAAGTRMNTLADQHGFIVVYPEQAASANAGKCWNWFQPQDQARGSGEPSLIAGIVGEVASRFGADPQRLFVAGLSAGAAMAVVLGETYPELIAGVGVHSGLAYRSAHDMGSAMAAMKGGRSGLPGMKAATAEGPRHPALHAVPTIVFHGDRDHTVQAVNAERVVQQAREAFEAEPAAGELQANTQTGATPAGRRYTRTVFTDAAGRARVESWTVHGAGHAWSGGDASGSFTDASGPDASAEMVRFFLALRRGNPA